MSRVRTTRVARSLLNWLTAVALTGTTAAQSPFGLEPLLSGNQCEWLDVGDLNGDGRLDVATTQSSAQPCVFLAAGRGTFHAATLLAGPSGSGSTDLVLSDLDDDGDLDIVTGNFSSNVHVFLNSGQGIFGTGVAYPLGGFRLAVGDLDGNQLPDVVGSAGGTVRVALGSGAGALATPTGYPLAPATAASDVALCDVDQDERLDIVAGCTDALVVVLYGDGTGAFGPAQAYAVGIAGNKRLAVGDWNEDLWPDVAVAFDTLPTASVGVLLNSGAGTFGAPSSFASPANQLIGIETADVDGDDHADLAISSLDDSVYLWSGIGDGSFSEPQRLITSGWRDLALAELDGDLHVDLATANVVDGLRIVRGNAAGELQAERVFPLTDFPDEVASGDLDHDGWQDIVVASNDAAFVAVMLGDGAGGLGSEVLVPCTSPPRRIALGLVDADAYLDVAGHCTDQVVRIAFGDGQGGFGTFASAVTIPGLRAMALGDATGDGLADLAFTDLDQSGQVDDSQLAILQGDGARRFTPLAATDMSFARGVALADFNGDGLADAVGSDPFSLKVLLSDGLGEFVVTSVSSPQDGTFRLRVADVDGDGRTDLGADHGVGFVVHYNSGGGNLASSSSFGTANVDEVVFDDFDGDGDQDAATFDMSIGNVIGRWFEGDGAGSFSAAGDFPLSVGALSPLAFDANGDGLPELVLLSLVGPSVNVVENRGAGIPPAVYCTAKTTSNGCVPAIGWSGESSAGATSGFSITCADVINNKTGLLFYSLNGRAHLPFHQGFHCAKLPTKRTLAQSSGGNPPPNDCSGSYSLDFNAFAQGLAGGNPSAQLLVPGTAVTAQWWGRDPGFAPPANDMLSDALDLLIGP